MLKPSVVVSDTGPATAYNGGIAVSGYLQNLTITSHEPTARSGYAEIVALIAPEKLLDRDDEIRILTDFCTSPDAPSYLWWRAEAWAGKTALLSWFTRHPPADVQVLPFFINARFAEQSDRNGFLAVLLLQLAELLDEPAPGYLPSPVQEAQFRLKLSQATTACARNAKRLVLIVDGLDEDLGVTPDEHAHSIAALLPAEPPPGLRIVVSSRPNPPLPGDVLDNHPLRQRSAVRELRESPHARVLRSEMARELRRLLYGGPDSLSILGFLIASGGGLSARDLSSLTGSLPGFVEDRLRTASGRTFLARPPRWRSGSEAESYFLGHEELQRTAREFIGVHEISRYAEDIKAWADGFHTDRWPDITPQYLLQDYFLLLQRTGDHDRMFACAVSEARHDRLLEVVGGDTIAIAEIAAVQQSLTTRPDPDLVKLTQLAFREGRLRRRNAHVPSALAEFWALRGDFVRAQELAQSIHDEFHRTMAIGAVARVAAQREDLYQAERIITSIADPGQRDLVASQAAPAAALRHPGWAAAIVRGMTDEIKRDTTLITVATAVMEEDCARGTALVTELADPPVLPTVLLSTSLAALRRRPECLATVIAALPSQDMLGPFLVMALRQQLLGLSLPDPDLVASLQRALDSEPDPAIRTVGIGILGEALLLRTGSCPSSYARELDDDLDAIDDPELKIMALASLIRITGPNDPERAQRLAITAYELRHESFQLGPDPFLFDALMMGGNPEFAVQRFPEEALAWMQLVLANELDDFPDDELDNAIQQCGILIETQQLGEARTASYLDLATIVRRRGPARAAAIVRRALSAADQISLPVVRDRWLLDIIKIAYLTDPTMVDGVLESFGSAPTVAIAMAELAVAAADVDEAYARERAATAELIARSIFNRHEVDDENAVVAENLGQLDVEKAVLIAARITDDEVCARTYFRLLRRSRSAPAHRRLLEQKAADAVAGVTTDWQRAELLAELAAALHTAGDPEARRYAEEAVVIVRGIDDLTLAEIARSVALNPEARTALLDEAVAALPALLDHERTKVMIRVINAVAELDTSRARAMLGTLDGDERERAVEECIATIARHDPAAAERLVRTAKASIILATVIATERPADAYRLIRRLPGGASDPEDLAPVLAACGRMDDAFAVAAAISDQDRRDNTFSRIASTAAMVDARSAIPIVNRITDLRLRYETYAMIGMCAEPDLARELAVQALAAGSWKVAAPLLTRIDPDAVVAVADAILDEPFD